MNYETEQRVGSVSQRITQYLRREGANQQLLLQEVADQFATSKANVYSLFVRLERAGWKVKRVRQGLQTRFEIAPPRQRRIPQAGAR